MMPEREPGEDEPPHDTRAGAPMTREQWLACYVARAPKITPQQWADMLLLLRTRNRAGNESENEQEAG